MVHNSLTLNDIVNVLNTTKLYSLKWLILYSLNFTLIFFKRHIPMLLMGMQDGRIPTEGYCLISS